eukprot:scaffold1130_cov195-Pinguiococcus_pyrenoidosus.AAC.86
MQQEVQVGRNRQDHLKWSLRLASTNGERSRSIDKSNSIRLDSIWFGLVWFHSFRLVHVVSLQFNSVGLRHVTIYVEVPRRRWKLHHHAIHALVDPHL